MKEISKIVAENIVILRKQHKLTQVEFAKKINYSGKAVSRWEKAEVVPDLETLDKISVIFSVPLASLLEEHKPEDFAPRQRSFKNQVAVQMLAVMVAWTVMTISFVYLQLTVGYSWWQAFVWAVPLSCLILLFYNNRWHKNRLAYLIEKSIFSWSLITAFYLQLISQNLYLVFIIGIPIQACLLAEYFIKAN